MVLSTVFTQEMDMDAPSIRNSNLLPVKAKGEVRLRSLESACTRGRVATPMSMILRGQPSLSRLPSAIFCKISWMSLPRYMERMAGGASYPPNRQSLV